MKLYMLLSSCHPAVQKAVYNRYKIVKQRNDILPGYRIPTVDYHDDSEDDEHD